MLRMTQSCGNKVPCPARGWQAVRVLTVFLAAALSLGLDLFDPVAKKNQEGSRLYRDGQFEEALKRFQEAQLENPRSPMLHYNVGTALYKKEAFSEAEKELLQAGKSDQGGLGAGAFYNLGNALYKQSRFQEAIDAYKQSLRIEPDDLDAKINLEMAARQMDQQQDQKQDQQKEEDQSQQDEQDEGEQQQNQDQDEQQQDREQSDDANEDAQKQPADPSDQEQEDKLSQGQPNEGLEAQPEQGLTREEAERILEALSNRELQAQKHRRIRLTGRRYTGNQW